MHSRWLIPVENTSVPFPSKLHEYQEKQLILVDHNERSQAVDNIEEAEILEILDHHRIGSLETFQPIMFRNQPVGCTATIMYEIYAEKYLEIRKISPDFCVQRFCQIR